MKKAAIATATAGIAVTAFAAPAMASASTVVVQSGDTLWGIAQKTNTSVDTLKKLNKLTDDNIYPGQKLVINEVQSQKSEKSVTATWLNVRQGPSASDHILTSLKGGTKVTVESDEANGWHKISYDNGKTGFVNGKYLGDAKNTVQSKPVHKAVKAPQKEVKQQVKQSAPLQKETATNITSYQVKSGDTLWALAVKFGTSVQDLMAWNNLSSSSIYVGQNLAVKESAAKAAPQKVVKQEVKQEAKIQAPAPKQKHVAAPAPKVKQEITSKQQAQPKQENKQVVPAKKETAKAPSIDTNASSYTVRSGDSLSKIATIFGTSVDHLKALNSLSSDALQVGQVLKVKGQVPSQNNTNNQATNHSSANKTDQTTNTSSHSNTNNNKPAQNTSNNNSSNTNASTNTNQGASYSALISEAQKHLGKPYGWGANGPSSFDCSGYTKYVFNSIGISIPRTSSAQYAAATKISESQARPGDLVFFNYGSGIAHVGIYVGGGQMINAQDNGVKYDNIHGQGWGKYLVGFGRVANF